MMKRTSPSSSNFSNILWAIVFWQVVPSTLPCNLGDDAWAKSREVARGAPCSLGVSGVVMRAALERPLIHITRSMPASPCTRWQWGGGVHASAGNHTKPRRRPTPPLEVVKRTGKPEKKKREQYGRGAGGAEKGRAYRHRPSLRPHNGQRSPKANLFPSIETDVEKRLLPP